MNVELKGSKKENAVAKAMVDFIYNSPFLNEVEKIENINSIKGVKVIM